MSIGITGTGSYIPSKIVENKDFEQHEFLNADGSEFKHENTVIIEKFKTITGIAERRYAEKKLNTSDIAFLASEKAISDAGIDKEEIDYIILAHNFGDVAYGGDSLWFGYVVETRCGMTGESADFLPFMHARCAVLSLVM